MSENKKPRIAEILGVEVGERFSLMGFQPHYAEFWIKSDGTFETKPPCIPNSTVALLRAIEQPCFVIRKSRWTDDEIEFVKLFQASCKNKIFFERLKGTGILVWGEEGLDPVANSVLPYKLLPSLKEGERATASEIIGGAE